MGLKMMRALPAWRLFSVVPKGRADFVCRLGLAGRTILIAGCLLSLTLLCRSEADAAEKPQTRPWPRLCPESDRFGFTAGDDIFDVDTEELNAGWYHSFKVRKEEAPRPGGVWFAQTIRLSDESADDYDPGGDPICSGCPTWDVLGDAVEANPGSLWFIGNEQDRIIRQDDVCPEVYAQLYHDFYAFLKAADPTCQVGIGGVVQPTPLRFEYLQRILDAYRERYHQRMPIDVWNVHNYALPEIPSQPDAGAGIPRLSRWYEPYEDCPAAERVLIESLANDDFVTDDHDSVDLFASQLAAFRQKMRDWGYQDRPLVLSEFGILYPVVMGFPFPRVQTYMQGTIDWLLTASDPRSDTLETGTASCRHGLGTALATWSSR